MSQIYPKFEWRPLKLRLLLIIETGSITDESYLEWQTSNRCLFTFMLTKAKKMDWIVQTQINQSNLQINKKAEEYLQWDEVAPVHFYSRSDVFVLKTSCDASKKSSNHIVIVCTDCKSICRGLEGLDSMQIKTRFY